MYMQSLIVNSYVLSFENNELLPEYEFIIRDDDCNTAPTRTTNTLKCCNHRCSNK